MSGQRLGGIVPYGYIKDETGQLVIDEETAPIVKLIFQLCVEGNGTGKIARILKEREIPTPGTIIFQRTGRAGRYHPDNPCLWRGETISGILAQDAYLGQTTNFKYSKPSFKSKKIARNPPEKRMLFENTHPAIIDPDTWEIAQKNREQRKRPMKQDEIGLFSGLVICSDCGKRLTYTTTLSGRLIFPRNFAGKRSNSMALLHQTVTSLRNIKMFFMRGKPCICGFPNLYGPYVNTA